VSTGSASDRLETFSSQSITSSLSEVGRQSRS
jgi:hypothetical protein